MMNTTPLITLSLALTCTFFTHSTLTMAATTSPTLEWIDQFGSNTRDESRSVSADGLGNVYVSGVTYDTLGWPDARRNDAYVRKYDASGTLLWTEQLGTNSEDWSSSVSADGLGNVYISGNTEGSLGGTNAGGRDMFVSKYDTNGTLLWTEQLGTSTEDNSYGVSADSMGNVYISGYTEGSLNGTNAGGRDAFVSKYNTSGTLLWTEQLGTSGNDVSHSVSVDDLGNVYISGITQGSLGETNSGLTDVFVSKYDANGTLIWTEQIGSGSIDHSYSASADGLGNVYISGATTGNLGGANVGNADVFVSKYNTNGTLLWTEQLGTGSFDVSYGVSADGLGNVYISGITEGSLGGTNAGDRDAFVSKYDANGTLLWTEQLGTNSYDYSYGVSADGLGNVYISGTTSGILGGTSAGGYDAFIVKYSDQVPEPSSLLLVTLASVGLLLRWKRTS